jgi:hypothetical protein
MLIGVEKEVKSGGNLPGPLHDADSIDGCRTKIIIIVGFNAYFHWKSVQLFP